MTFWWSDQLRSESFWENGAGLKNQINIITSFCLRYDPLIVFRRQNRIAFNFTKTMSYDLLTQMAYLWTTNKGFTPCKGIQNSLGFWSLRCVYRIPRYGIPVFVSETRFLELYSGFHKHFFPDSEFHRPKFPGFQNPVALTSASGSAAPSFLSLTFTQPKRVCFLFLQLFL